MQGWCDDDSIVVSEEKNRGLIEPSILTQKFHFAFDGNGISGIFVQVAAEIDFDGIAYLGAGDFVEGFLVGDRRNTEIARALGDELFQNPTGIAAAVGVVGDDHRRRSGFRRGDSLGDSLFGLG